MIPYKLIQSEKELAEIIPILSSKKVLGMDLEGEWNLHRYGMHLCLIQIFDGEMGYLIDPLKISDLKPFLDIVEDPSILKLTHGPQSDFVLLDKLFATRPKNIFDTQRAAQFLGYSSTSLAGLLDLHFGVSKNEKVRDLDWFVRPMNAAMIEYALRDVAYLPQLQDILTKELKEKGKWEWQVEENLALEDIRFVPKTKPYLEMKGANKLPAKARRMLGRLYDAREQIARDVDKPSGYIIPNQMLIGLALEPPLDENEWKEFRGVHPALKRYSKMMQDAVLLGESGPIPKLDKEEYDTNPLRLNYAERIIYEDRKEKLNLVREKIEAKFPDIHTLILSQKTIQKLAFGLQNEFLRNWQSKVILDFSLEFDINLDFMKEESRLG